MTSTWYLIFTNQALKLPLQTLANGPGNPRILKAPYLLFMNANDFITGWSLALPTCYWPNYHQPIMLKIRLAWLWSPPVWLVLPWLRVIWLVDLTCERHGRHEREFRTRPFQNNRTGERKIDDHEYVIVVRHFTLTVDWLRRSQVTVTQTRFCRLFCQVQVRQYYLALAKRGWWSWLLRCGFRVHDTSRDCIRRAPWTLTWRAWELVTSQWTGSQGAHAASSELYTSRSENGTCIAVWSPGPFGTVPYCSAASVLGPRNVNRAHRQSGFPTFISCQSQDANDDNRTKVTNSVTSARSLWWHVGPYFWSADLTRTANPIGFGEAENAELAAWVQSPSYEVPNTAWICPITHWDRNHVFWHFLLSVGVCFYRPVQFIVNETDWVLVSR